MESRILFRLIDLVYDAALNPPRWDEFLKAYAEAQDSTATSLVRHNDASEHGQIMVGANFDPHFQKLYDEYYSSVNIWKNKAKDRHVTGAIIRGLDVVGESELFKSEWYNEFLRPMRARHKLAGYIEARPPVSCSLTTLRSRGRGLLRNRSGICCSVCSRTCNGPSNCMTVFASRRVQMNCWMGFSMACS